MANLEAAAVPEPSPPAVATLPEPSPPTAAPGCWEKHYLGHIIDLQKHQCSEYRPIRRLIGRLIMNHHVIAKIRLYRHNYSSGAFYFIAQGRNRLLGQAPPTKTLEYILCLLMQICHASIGLGVASSRFAPPLPSPCWHPAAEASLDSTHRRLSPSSSPAVDAPMRTIS
jgi:hypothetical protein